MATAKVSKQPMHERISRALRQVWRWAPAKRDALKQAKTSIGLYICASCKFPTERKQIFVDHVEPVGPAPGSKNGDGITWDGFISRLFVGVEALQCLCISCHSQKTVREALERRGLVKRQVANL